MSMQTEPDLPNDPDSGVPPRPSSLRFPVVGIGASAGGLAALTSFFEAMPADTGMAFVVILHLSPTHKSHVAEILQRVTPLHVEQVAESVAIERNHVYVIPPTQQLSMTDGMLVLTPEVRERGRHIAIDVFFRTLAHAHREHAVGIVLSGTGADGAVGIARIKEQGGISIAQAPREAEYDGMPRAAVATGQVDFVLPAADIPAKLLQLAAVAREIRLPPDIADDLKASPSPLARAEDDEQALREVMALLRTRTQHDFRLYKRATVLRRIERRMQVSGATSLPAYRDHLRDDADETPALLQDMLISVTNFFRDREAFDVLEREVLPQLVAQQSAGEPLRAWAAGCATGEEAYSLAMLLQEAHDRRVDETPFQVFATDIDDRALRTGRNGLYPASVAGDLTPTRMRQFLHREQDQYRVAKQLRDRVLFAHHNLMRDPPFSRLNLIVCRNLLIYLQRDAQASLLETFRFALAPGGVLFLGLSESVEVVADLFEPIDKKHRLYRVNARAQWHRAPPLAALAITRAAPEPAAPVPDKRGLPFADMHQRALRLLVPASVLIDAEQNILHLSEGANRFLMPQTGVPSLNLVANVHPALRLELRAALFKAQQTGSPVEARAVRRGSDGGDTDARTQVHMVVRAYQDPDVRMRTVLVTFDEVRHSVGGPPADDDHAIDGAQPGKDLVVGELESENLRLTSQLQDTLEQAETSTEELKSSNEELQAINEELRSATEELETSKEELQSVNEELVTVNHELATRVEETGRVNDDLQNFIASTDIATVFVDGTMRVKRYTPRAAELFHLIPTDVGRSLMDLTHQLDYGELAADAEGAFKHLKPVEREVSARDGRTFMANCRPYRSTENRIEGAVLTFIDVSARRQAEEAASQGAQQLRILAESTKDFAIMITDALGLVTRWNEGARRIFGWEPDEIVGQPLALVFTDDDRARGVPEQEMRTAAEKGRAEDERWHKRKDGSIFYCSGVMTVFDGGTLRGFAKIARDMTGSKQAELAREALLLQERSERRDAQAAVASKDEFLAVMSHELKHPLNLIGMNAELLMRLPQLRHLEPAMHAAKTIQRTVVAQAKIVDDLLDLSRARTGKLTLQLAQIDWSATVRAIVEAVQIDAEAKGVALTLQTPDAPLLALFDRVRAEQVAWNLLSNAVKFTPPGGSVQVTLAEEAGALRLEVADTGKGIDAAFIDHVFEMFAQESSLERRREGGLGVGLALVRELVTAHGGRVAAASPGVGQGATFTVWVPRGSDVLALAPPAAPAQGLAGLRILLVDDSADTVFSLGALLRMSGASVTPAEGGAAALRCLDAGDFDVVISDISMPDVSGLELIRNLRARPLQRQPITIACSGYSRAQDAQQALDAGFDAKLSKPVLIDELEQLILSLTAARRARDGVQG